MRPTNPYRNRVSSAPIPMAASSKSPKGMAGSVVLPKITRATGAVFWTVRIARAARVSSRIINRGIDEYLS